MRPHPETLITSPWRPQPLQADVRPTLLIAAAPGDAPTFAASQFDRVIAHTTADALRLLRGRPRVLAIDLDVKDIDAVELCRQAVQAVGASVLVTASEPERVPALLKAGCHAVLLKPFAPNLLATRLGRLSREHAPLQQGRDRIGTNRRWPSTPCPKCGTSGATSFDFASYRRMWYACLACEAVWLGRRQE